MNPNDSSEISVTTLLALRREPEALRIITERLKVKEMGPADHIRTKHEVKAFIETGEKSAAEELLKRAQTRHELAQTATIRQSYKPEQRIGPG